MILLRHGATAFTGSRYSGRGTDPPLSAAGKAQAAAAATWLGTAPPAVGAAEPPASAAGEVVLAVVSSPLRRARWTAEIVAAVLGVPLSVDEALAEVDFGVLEGLTFAEISARWPDEVERWLGSADVAPPGGESLSALRERVLRARDRVPAGALVVTHATPIQVMVGDALGLDPVAALRLRVDPGGVSRVDGQLVAYVNRIPSAGA